MNWWPRTISALGPIGLGSLIVAQEVVAYTSCGQLRDCSVAVYSVAIGLHVRKVFEYRPQDKLHKGENSRFVPARLDTCF